MPKVQYSYIQDLINYNTCFCCLVLPWLDKPKEDLVFEKFKGDSVSFECGAKGFPLQVEWKFQKHGEYTLRPLL